MGGKKLDIISFERNMLFRSNEMISRERNNIHFSTDVPLGAPYYGTSLKSTEPLKGKVKYMYILDYCVPSQ